MLLGKTLQSKNVFIGDVQIQLLQPVSCFVLAARLQTSQGILRKSENLESAYLWRDVSSNDKDGYWIDLSSSKRIARRRIDRLTFADTDPPLED